jgi:DNA-binding XRE family transcriptional regulator
MDDLETLKRASLLLGQYGFEAEQEQVAKAIRIISATARRLGVVSDDRRRGVGGSQGERLKVIRERVGRTRGQLAEMCGVNMSTVRAHENSEHDIPEEAARAYAQALGVTPSMILYGSDLGSN